MRTQTGCELASIDKLAHDRMTTILTLSIVVARAILSLSSAEDGDGQNDGSASE